MIPSPPIATYRLQFTRQFGFEPAMEILSYLQSLGISHVYASPFFKARSGSTHGYDIVDHSALNPELGGERAFLRFSDALLRRGMGLIVDFVPNHMCVEGVRNEWWWNALQFGPGGRHAAHFDIDWHALPGPPRVLLPVLGKPYDQVLKDGEIRLEYSGSAFKIRYFDHAFPIRPESCATLLREAEDADNSSAILAQYDPRADGQAGERLHQLLERQHYRLSYWRLAGSQINYRRFFDINSLAGLRVERKETFVALHPLVARLLQEGRLQGLRIDHIDGLSDPAEYCRRLQALFHSLGRDDVYLVVEKILGECEQLPHWAGVAGTTGYEWMNTITRTFVDPEGLEELANYWEQISPDDPEFDEVLRSAKSQVLAQLFTSEFNVLVRLLQRIAAGHRSTRDLAPEALRATLWAYIIEFPIYRTYAAGNEMSASDCGTVNATLACVRDRNSHFGEPVLDFLRGVLTLELVRKKSGHSASRVRRFVMKLQQLTGPVMAKSLEDTALYRDHRLLALNEVGNEPSLPPLSLARFHERMEERAREFPHGLTATATHDTKRGEDARMRILAIAGVELDWRNRVVEWRALNAQHAETRNNIRAPSAGHEYMLYQAMIGAWPEGGPTEEFVRRLSEYAIKAARESKRESNWLEPDGHYEAGLRHFIEKLFDPDLSMDFLASFEEFAERCALIGALYSLSQLALKSMMPGVPDFYQGTGLWDLSFVDPDNRRPVNFAANAALLEEATSAADGDLFSNWRSGRLKLALTAKLLAFRRSRPSLFNHGIYHPLDVGTDEAIAFARLHESAGCAVIVGRRFARASTEGRRWPRSLGTDTVLALPKGWLSLKTIIGQCVEPGASDVPMTVLGQLPIAVLELKQRSRLLRY